MTTTTAELKELVIAEITKADIPPVFCETILSMLNSIKSMPQQAGVINIDNHRRESSMKAARLRGYAA